MDSETTSNVFRCIVCSALFEAPIVIFLSREFRYQHCPSCCERLSVEHLAKIEVERKRRQEFLWARICPEIYRETDLARIVSARLDLVNAWNMGPNGLGFVGETGRGKTRLLFLALRRAFDAGRTVAAVSHNRFSLLAQNAFAGETQERGDARATFANYRTVNVLLLDDLGKAPRTERADAEFEELVEHRCANKLPILFTANASGEWLMRRFGEDRGPALVRRLGEFCEVHTL